MGKEIDTDAFGEADFEAFLARVRDETALLKGWEQDGLLRDADYRLGFELEGWLCDSNALPAPRNTEFLERLDHPDIVPELARFNFEVNCPPVAVGASMFDQMYARLSERWSACRDTAATMGLQTASIGILPTVRGSDLTLATISDKSRYRALNEQILRLRDGQAIEIDIDGEERLQTTHDDVMLEAATTSLQLHFQVGSAEAARANNVSKILSAPMVALSANAPYFLGHDLYRETRIPLFEQAIAVGHSEYTRRVSFGIRYVTDSLIECFEANRDRYPPLLPSLSDETANKLPHLMLHNGTIWRWNRPLVGFGADGKPAYRIEHRVCAAGTSILDDVANTALYVGLLLRALKQAEPPERTIPFETARENFYQCARFGLDATVRWNGAAVPVRTLLLDRLLPEAADGLAIAGLGGADVERWLGIIRARVLAGRTGADWQRHWVARHGRDWAALANQYLTNQSTGAPVHEWTT